MKNLGRLFGILAIMGMLIGFIPFLGWMNWFVIPFAIIGLVVSLLGRSKGGTVICVVAILLGMLRLLLGGGIF